MQGFEIKPASSIIMAIRDFSNKNLIIIFLTCWGIMNILQAAFTPLHNDEAYYWMYSNYPAWGYYDHPPMIAFFIGLGYKLFNNELGVRLLVVLSNFLTLFIIWKLTEGAAREEKHAAMVFILLVILMPVFNVYGFIATPDAPLLLFASLFLLFYKRFLENERTSDILALGLSMAGMMYSKYHGALLILLIIISNPGLLLKIRFYAASFLAVILFLPHILWQVNNDFPSLKYHLVDRASGIDLFNIPEFVLNQLAIHNPVFIVVAVWLLIKYRTGDQFSKSLVYVFAGFLIFFLVSSFRDHVEPHWTAIVAIPLTIILFNSSGKTWNKGTLLKKSAILLFPLILITRIALTVDFLPLSYLKGAFHGNKDRVIRISEVAGKLPVVFTNSFQNPSQYTFHTGNFAHSLNSLAYRRTQYDLWDFEERLHGKEVIYIPHWLSSGYIANLEKYCLSNGDTLYARKFRNFQSLQRECVVLPHNPLVFRRDTTNSITLGFTNPYPFNILLDHPELPVQFHAAFFDRKKLLAKGSITVPDSLKTLFPGDTVIVECSFAVPSLPGGDYSFAVTSETGCLFDVLSSKIVKAKVIN